MFVNTPPMGWNTWNTFGHNINEELVLKMVDLFVEKGYKDAGYEYVVIDDCWSGKERDETDRLVADREKFPHGMKYIGDYIHSKGLKFGMYSCAGTRTCANYPGSYEHEYIDAKTFAEWGVDLLKYDFCFYDGVDSKRSYLTMSMALRASGRDILFSACQWGMNNPAQWMRSVGAHMFRSTYDINDTYESQLDIITKQKNNFNGNAAGCFNDLDMLTVGMYGNGLVGRPTKMTFDEYEQQFAFWCFNGCPLMMGADLSKVDDDCLKLMQNKELIAINQDKECRPAYLFCENETRVKYALKYIRQLENNEFAIAIFNLHDNDVTDSLTFSQFGIPFVSGRNIDMKDIMTGEVFKEKHHEFQTVVKAHHFKIFRCKYSEV